MHFAKGFVVAGNDQLEVCAFDEAVVLDPLVALAAFGADEFGVIIDVVVVLFIVLSFDGEDILLEINFDQCAFDLFVGGLAEERPRAACRAARTPIAP